MYVCVCVCVCGAGMLVFRMCRSCPKVPLKVVHTIIQAAALVFAGVGLAAAFDYHDRTNAEHMFSLHSWLGLIIVILFGLQVVDDTLLQLLTRKNCDRSRSDRPH